MKLSDVNFCSLCLNRKICPKHKEEPRHKGTTCLAWQGDEAKKARMIAEGRWFNV